MFENAWKDCKKSAKAWQSLIKLKIVFEKFKRCLQREIIKKILTWILVFWCWAPGLLLIFFSTSILYRFFSRNMCPKMQKSMVLASQSPSKILPTSIEKQHPRKHIICHRFLLECMNLFLLLKKHISCMNLSFWLDRRRVWDSFSVPKKYALVQCIFVLCFLFHIFNFLKICVLAK